LALLPLEEFGNQLRKSEAQKDEDQWVRQAQASGMDLKEARATAWTADYLMYGEALGAFEFAARTGTVPILIVDEIDKLTDTVEDMLLQLFGRGFAHVPRFGDVGEKGGEAIAYRCFVVKRY
jgi:hypothetical protein